MSGILAPGCGVEALEGSEQESVRLCNGGQLGTFIDASGLDGCTWMIETEDGERLEPVNLEDFSVTPEANLEIQFKYESSETMSICMNGKTVQITCIEKR